MALLNCEKWYQSQGVEPCQAFSKMVHFNY
jgi:hypothetical protein